MSAAATSSSSTKPSEPAGTGVTPTPAHEGAPHGEDLDLEEDIAPNLGGEDQMQDA